MRRREVAGSTGISLAVGGLAPIAVGALLVPVRDEIDNANLALLIVAITKFTSGAWVPIIVIPLIVLVFKGIRSHYDGVAEGLRVPPEWSPPRQRHDVVVLAHEVDTGVLDAVAYARSTAPDHLVAVTVVADVAAAEQAEKQWQRKDVDAPLEIVRAPSGDFTTATLRYIDEVERRWVDTKVTLHNQSALVLKGRLLFRANIAVTSIPYGFIDAG